MSKQKYQEHVYEHLGPHVLSRVCIYTYNVQPVAKVIAYYYWILLLDDDTNFAPDLIHGISHHGR
jgi:hypothetical protein